MPLTQNMIPSLFIAHHPSGATSGPARSVAIGRPWTAERNFFKRETRRPTSS
jgi:hypothetical protein